MTHTAALAKYGLLDDDREPTDNDLDPTSAEPDDYGDPFDLYEEPSVGGCAYCDSADVFRREPFGGRDACEPCWRQICFGEGEDR